jgi:hypothetical protein
MIESAFERKNLAAINAEEKEIEELIVQQDAHIIFALRKGEEISLEAEKEALRLRGLLSDIKGICFAPPLQAGRITVVRYRRI